jgi:hypothetical protein
MINRPRMFPTTMTLANFSTRKKPSSLDGGGSGRMPMIARAMNRKAPATAQPAPARSRRVAPRMISAPQPTHTDARSGTVV